MGQEIKVVHRYRSVTDRGRDVAGPSSLHSKKPIKPGGYIIGLPGRSNVLTKPTPGEPVNVLSEEWENIAEEVDGSELSLFVDAAETDEDFERTEALLCGAIKMLKASRAKPDVPHCFHLMVLAKLKPSMFSRSMLVTDALCSLLRRDHAMSFKTKSNPSVAVMAASILLIAHQEERCWPEQFIRAFIDDSLGERVWVDMAECKGFVDNIITAFKTKMPPKNFMFPDMALGNRPDCPSPPISTCSGGGESGDGDSEMSLECKESLDVAVSSRYFTMIHRVEELVMETVHNQFSLRHQNVDSVARNFIRFLSSVTGIMEVRKIVSTKLESWLQSPKLQRPATELLMSLCMNCNTHLPADVETIGHIIRFRIKHKPLLNQYMSCLKELLAAHPDNIQTAIKNTIYNELSNARNPSNMPILSVIFQFAPEHSAITLAEEFQELFCNKEDFHRALRMLFREIVRGLRYDMLFQKFCQGLMSEPKDPLVIRENPEICERMFFGVTDIIVMVMFVAISPAVRESAMLLFRGEHRDLECVRRYQEMVSSIQQDAMSWMLKTVPKLFSPSKDDYMRALHKLLMMDPPDTYAIKDNYPAENDRLLFVKLASEVPLKQETLMRLLMIAVTKDQWVKPQDLIELVDKLIKRATSLPMEDVEVLHIDDPKIIDLIFNLSLYIPPESAYFPHGYRPPKMAVTTSYWKAWTMLLLVTAHNPGVFGQLAWESYPTLRMMMEMCITNSFVFPLPTLLAAGEKAEDVINHEHLLVAKDKEVILQLEEYLAQKTINEQNSLLVSQTMSMDYHGVARKPPPAVMDQLKALNASHRIGHLLCRSRNPDFLLDIITRQGTSQSMPWLAELVQSHENAFSMLPETAALQTPHSCWRRPIASHSTTQCVCAASSLLTVLRAAVSSVEQEADLSDHTWLLKHLKSLPAFPQVLWSL
ncbi:hypothetical protein HAZT_HAZT006049 [Hyalella azteca]|uniref:Integrator complex subunit 1 RPB2-binding domain-containing protein n=1 Tax=Hyalella azteca TaxID=294128 RepID=A0A6A0HCZ2_HYAAZ|nr:hypothetical protein HAZT_HAZT006049 [Hyalella azteca]